MMGDINESDEWVGAITQGSTGVGFFNEEDMLVEDNEDMYDVVDSDEELIDHETNCVEEQKMKGRHQQQKDQMLTWMLLKMLKLFLEAQKLMLLHRVQLGQ